MCGLSSCDTGLVALWRVGSYFPKQGNLQWKSRFLNTVPPGKSQEVLKIKNIPDKELKFSLYKEVTQIDHIAENVGENGQKNPKKPKNNPQKKHMLKMYILKSLGPLLIKAYSLKDDIFFPDS